MVKNKEEQEMKEEEEEEAGTQNWSVRSQSQSRSLHDGLQSLNDRSTDTFFYSILAI